MLAPMPRFTYAARDGQGRSVSGEVDAASRVQALMQLRARQLWVTSLAPAGTDILEVVLDAPAPPRPAPSVRPAPGQWSYSLWPVRAGSLRDFFDQLGELVEAGVNLYESLTVLPNRVHWRLRPILREISPALAQGQGLAEQLARYPQVFAGSTVGLVRAGERSGQLGAMCRLLADQYRQDHRLWLSLLPTRAYGWIVVFFAVMVPLLPTVLPAVMEWSLAHPDATTLDQLEQLGNHYWPLLVHKLLPLFGSLVMLDWLVRWVLRQPWAAGVRQDLLGVIPGAAGYLRSAGLTRVLTVLEAMARAGASYDDALRLAAQAAGPGRLGRQLLRAAARVATGEPLGTAIGSAKSLPFTVRGAILTAEQAGAQQQTLGRLAQMEREKLESAPRRLALSGYLAGMLVFGVITGVAVALAYKAYLDAAFTIGEKLMP